MGNAERFGTKGYAVATGTAVLISQDLGVTFKTHKYNNVDTTTFPGRYGAYPSATTWYVSMGAWPQAPPPPPGSPERAVEDDSELVHEFGDIHQLRRHKTTGVTFHHWRTPVGPEAVDGSTYAGAIIKTVNGGANWTVQYQSTGRFYFNGIHCATEDKCVAVAEGHNVAQPGGHIFTTQDGGKSWHETHTDDGAGASMMQTRMVSETEAIAVGSNAQFPMTFKPYHSLNGGFNWTLPSKPVLGVSPVGMDCFDGSHCMVAAATVTQQCTVLLYK